MARPTSCTPELVEEICDRLIEGETLRAICRDQHMPSYRSVYRWCLASPEISSRIARAREAGFDAIADEALEIANTPKQGVRTEESDDGFKTVRDDMLGHRKLQVETRLKLLAKWAPKKYGDKIDVTTGNESLNLTPEERKAKLAAIAAAAAQRKQEPDDGSDLL